MSRSVAEVAYLEEGLLRAGGCIALKQPDLEQFVQRLNREDHVILEATGNTAAIVSALKPYAGRGIVTNPLQVRLIAKAKIKTDKIDAAILAQLYAAGCFLPEVWIPDDQMQALRRQVAQPLPQDERFGIEQRLRMQDQLGKDLQQIDQPLAQVALGHHQVERLMTITGVNALIALSLIAAIGAINRFTLPEKLVSYFGLNSSVYQSGLQPAKHGCISKRGRSHARGMLVEAAWAAAQTAGPLRAFFLRIRNRRGEQIAAVATARKLAVIVWHVLSWDEPFAWQRPALAARKRRQLQLQAGIPAQHGNRNGIGAAPI